MTVARTTDRKSVSFTTVVQVNDRSVECDILDISTGGAKIKLKTKAERGEKISLQIEPIGLFTANIMWNRNGVIGIKFEDDPARVAEVIMLLATYS